MIDARIIETLDEVYMTMKEFKYDPHAQFLGYLTTGETGYITSKNGARLQMQAFERDEVVEFMLEIFFETHPMDIYSGKSFMVAKNLNYVYQAMKSAGYNPINQVIGYIVTNDASYVTVKNNARMKISEYTVKDYCDVLVRSYLEFRRGVY